MSHSFNQASNCLIRVQKRVSVCLSVCLMSCLINAEERNHTKEDVYEHGEIGEHLTKVRELALDVNNMIF